MDNVIIRKAIPGDENVEVESCKTVRLLFSLQEMQDGETKFRLCDRQMKAG